MSLLTRVRFPERFRQILEPSGKSLQVFNSFVLLTFDKTVILEVSRTGTVNLALRPDVYCIIFQSLEVLSRQKTCFFYAMDA